MLAGFVDYLREQRSVSSLTVDATCPMLAGSSSTGLNGRLRELTVAALQLDDIDWPAAASRRTASAPGSTISLAEHAEDYLRLSRALGFKRSPSGAASGVASRR